MKKITIDNVELTLANPIVSEPKWIGQLEPKEQLSACWLKISAEDFPLTPRIIGVPGVGKTTLAMSTAREYKQPVYIMQCTSDTRPEDLLISPVLSDKGKISYHASPLLSAVITGGIAILDEGNRMAEKSWASLAGLFDNRRTVESIIAGITVTAHTEFRAAVTMNEDESTFEIPDYIMSRLQPSIEVGFPNKEDELKILSYNLPFSTDEVLDICVNFLQKAHGLDLPFSVRDGISIIRYTLKQKHQHPEKTVYNLFEKSVMAVLGKDALDLDSLSQKREIAKGNYFGSNPSLEQGLGNFFFGEDDPLNPDNHDEELF